MKLIEKFVSESWIFWLWLLGGWIAKKMIGG